MNKFKKKSNAELNSENAIDSNVLIAYAQILKWSFGSTIVILIITMSVVYYSLANSYNPTLEIVIASGAIGAFFSSLIRLYSYKDLPKVLLVDGLVGLSRGHLAIYSLVPPVVGGISAVALYILFAAGLLEGVALFPEFSCKPNKEGGNCSKFVEFLDEFGPTGPQDYAKVLVWGFIAGFAERLVPDTLGKFAQRQLSGD